LNFIICIFSNIAIKTTTIFQSNKTHKNQKDQAKKALADQKLKEEERKKKAQQKAAKVERKR
jgi:hypothetical protein